MTTNIATTKEQSARLLQCGVDPETADMSWVRGAANVSDGNLSLHPYLRMQRINWQSMRGRSEITPAWSLSALLALLPEKIEGGYWLTIQKCSRGKNASVHYGIAYFKCKWDNPEDISNSTITTLGRLKYFTDRDLIECAVLMIEWLTANNYKLNQL